ncbi:MAG: (Fe-S)-binding protein [Arenimonas sp.]
MDLSPSLVALADRCVQCGLCLPHCPTYRLDAVESESPRGRIAYMKALAGGGLDPTPIGDLHLDHCLGCRRCEGACPAGVEYGRLLVGARAAQFERAPKGAAIRIRLGLLARPRLLGRALGWYRRAYRWLPKRWRPLPRPPVPVAAVPASSSIKAGPSIFVGCVARSYEARARAALARLATAVGVEVTEPGGQGCCGAGASHAGDAAQAGALAAANAAAFAGSGSVLCLASGCQSTLADSLAGVVEVEDALVFLAARANGLRFRDAGGMRVALHRPCTQFALAGSIAATRSLLGMVPGLEVVELPDTGCCGAAGMHMVEFPERADALRRELLASFESAGGWREARPGQPMLPGTQILSVSHSCRLHLANGSLVPVRHPLELLADFLA